MPLPRPLMSQTVTINQTLGDTHPLMHSTAVTPNTHSFSLSVLTASFQVNLGWLVFIETKDDGGGADNSTTGTGAISLG